MFHLAAQWISRNITVLQWVPKIKYKIIKVWSQSSLLFLSYDVE